METLRLRNKVLIHNFIILYLHTFITFITTNKIYFKRKSIVVLPFICPLYKKKKNNQLYRNEVKILEVETV